MRSQRTAREQNRTPTPLLYIRKSLNATTTPPQAHPGVHDGIGKHTGHTSEADGSTGSHCTSTNGRKGVPFDA